MSLTLPISAALVNPAPAIEASVPFVISEAWWCGFTQGSDGFALAVPADLVAADLVESFRAGHWSGRDNFETALLAAAADRGEFVPGVEDEAEWLGYQLGADGVDAELLTPDDAERAAFGRGHDAGDAWLWEADPLFAAHLKERAERAIVADGSAWHDAEIAELGGSYSLSRA